MNITEISIDANCMLGFMSSPSMALIDGIRAMPDIACMLLSPGEHERTIKKLLNVSELAEVLNVKESWIYDRTCRGSTDVIPHIRLGRQLRFDLESDGFQRWLRAHGVGLENKN
jgi:hypothetical protein